MITLGRTGWFWNIRPGFLIIVGLILLINCGKKTDLPYRQLKLPQSVRDVHYLLRPERITLKWIYPGSTEGVYFEIWKKNDRDFIKIGETREYSFKYMIFFQKEVQYLIVSVTKEGLKQEYPLRVFVDGFPDPPLNFRFRVLNDGVQLMWEVHADCFYNIYRQSDRDEVILNREPLKEGTFFDSPEPFRSFIYYLRCKKGNVEGYASKVEITPDDYIPQKPSQLKFSLLNSRIILTWLENPEKWVKYYRIYRGNGMEFSMIGESVYPLFVDPSPSPQDSIYYVTAVGPSKESLPSEWISYK